MINFISSIRIGGEISFEALKKICQVAYEDSLALNKWSNSTIKEGDVNEVVRYAETNGLIEFKQKAERLDSIRRTIEDYGIPYDEYQSSKEPGEPDWMIHFRPGEGDNGADLKIKSAIVHGMPYIPAGVLAKLHVHLSSGAHEDAKSLLQKANMHNAVSGLPIPVKIETDPELEEESSLRM